MKRASRGVVLFTVYSCTKKKSLHAFIVIQSCNGFGATLVLVTIIPPSPIYFPLYTPPEHAETLAPVRPLLPLFPPGGLRLVRPL